MKHLSRWLRIGSLTLILAGIGLSGCTVKTTVQATATTSSNVTHLYVTVKELWFSSDAGATPDDDRWVKKVLSTPATIDLAALNDGTPGTIGTISLSGVSYAQLRVVLADTTETLAQSASDLGLAYNNVVQYMDAGGASHVVPLEFATPNASLLMPVAIKLNAIGATSTLAAATASGSTTTGVTGSSASSAATQATATITLDVDALRGLILFDYGGQTGALLNPGLHAYDDSEVGTISGSFDVSALTSDVIDSEQGIVVSAQTLSADGTHFIVVKSTRINSSGAFTLYPLPVDDATKSAAYDIVVHGPGIQTQIITGVTVDKGTITTVQSSALALPTATAFVVNTNSTVPGGTLAEFYQTLSTDNAPHLIETAAVNPFNGGFGNALGLASSPLIAGAYNNGDLISFASAPPQEGAATYEVVGNSPWRAISNFGATITGSSTAQTITVPPPNLPFGAVGRSLAGTISFSSPGLYDSLYVLISRGGQLVEAMNLSASLGGQKSINFTATNLPGGTRDAVYDVAVRAWNSGNAASTLTRVAFTTRADLRNGDVSGLTLQL